MPSPTPMHITGASWCTVQPEADRGEHGTPRGYGVVQIPWQPSPFPPFTSAETFQAPTIDIVRCTDCLLRLGTLLLIDCNHIASYTPATSCTSIVSSAVTPSKPPSFLSSVGAWKHWSIPGHIAPACLVEDDRLRGRLPFNDALSFHQAMGMSDAAPFSYHHVVSASYRAAGFQHRFQLKHCHTRQTHHNIAATRISAKPLIDSRSPLLLLMPNGYNVPLPL
jgi:hypothetical protein